MDCLRRTGGRIDLQCGRIERKQARVKASMLNGMKATGAIVDEGMEAANDPVART